MKKITILVKISIVFYAFCFSELTLSKLNSHSKVLLNEIPTPYGNEAIPNRTILSKNIKSEVNIMNQKQAPSKENPINKKPALNMEIATFAGGCFWCVEAVFEKVKGVKKVISGFAGGQKKHPSYKEVSSGQTNHVEAIQISFYPTKVSYKTLLDIYWKNINPTDSGGQFVDRGAQYRPMIFYHNETQKKEAEKSKKDLLKKGIFKKPITTEIVPYSTFFPAEEYHQDYYKKNPVRYWFYRSRSGRDSFLKQIWRKPQKKTKEPSEKLEKKQKNSIEQSPKKKEVHHKNGKNSSATEMKPIGFESYKKIIPTGYKKPSDEELKKRLSPLEYKVTQKNGTEPPFKNKYWNNKEPGIYVDIVSGEPLFSSKDKYDSKTGWPSFTRPLVKENISTHEDNTLFMKRTEVRSKQAHSHLGHVFNDGPPPTKLRYCINSAALRFIPVKELDSAGYSQFQKLFQ